MPISSKDFETIEQLNKFKEDKDIWGRDIKGVETIKTGYRLYFLESLKWTFERSVAFHIVPYTMLISAFSVYFLCSIILKLSKDFSVSAAVGAAMIGPLVLGGPITRLIVKILKKK